MSEINEEKLIEAEVVPKVEQEKDLRLEYHRNYYKENKTKNLSQMAQKEKCLYSPPRPSSLSLKYTYSRLLQRFKGRQVLRKEDSKSYQRVSPDVMSSLANYGDLVIANLRRLERFKDS